MFGTETDPWHLLFLASVLSIEVNEKTCSGLPDPIFLKPGLLPTTALASFQGSGNTWVRQILAGATGKTGDTWLIYS